MHIPQPTKPTISSLDRIQKALNKVVESKPYVQAAKSKIVAEEAPADAEKISKLKESMVETLQSIEHALEDVRSNITILADTAESLKHYDLDYSEALDAEKHFKDLIDSLINLESNLGS